MHNHHNRQIEVKKADLIDKLIENRDNHVKEYKEAVIAYHKEAAEQLKVLSKKLKSGEMDLSLTLITPVNRADEYDKLITMFRWDVRDIIPMSQLEFNEYVHDEFSFAKSAKFANAAYRAKF